MPFRSILVGAKPTEWGNYGKATANRALQKATATYIENIMTEEIGG